jgi:hypothetical protein
MKLVYKIGIAYGLAELTFQLYQWRRYDYFNKLRVTFNETKEELWTMVHAVVKKNPDIFERCKLDSQTAHIHREVDLYNVITCHPDETPANQLQVGCSKMYWRYFPLVLDIFMKTLRQVGGVYMKCALGFTQITHKTVDGYYKVWTHTVVGTKPIVFFPGLGLGAVPYAKFAKSFGRTVHIIEVPNLSSTIIKSNSQATYNTVYEVVSKHVDDGPDIFTHSMGCAHAAMYLNAIHGRDTPKHNVIISEGFVDPFDSVRSHIYPFVGIGDYVGIRKKPKYWAYFFGFVYMAVHDLECQAFTKRYHTFYHGTLWREYPNANITYVYTKYDILYDTEYIAKNSDCVFIPKGSHGFSIFGSGNLRFFTALRSLNA